MLISRNGLLILWCTIILCMAPGTARGDSLLQSRVEQLTQALKKQPPHVAVLAFVDWERSFKELTTERRESLGIASPELLRMRVKQIADDPVASFEKQFGRISAGYDPMRRQLLSEALASRASEMRAAWRRSQSELIKAGYAVHTIKIDPLDKSRAHVSLSSVGPNISEPLTFNFEKRGEQWYVVADITGDVLETL